MEGDGRGMRFCNECGHESAMSFKRCIHERWIFSELKRTHPATIFIVSSMDKGRCWYPAGCLAISSEEEV